MTLVLKVSGFTPKVHPDIWWLYFGAGETSFKVPYVRVIAGAFTQSGNELGSNARTANLSQSIYYLTLKVVFPQIWFNFYFEFYLNFTSSKLSRFSNVKVT